MIDKQMAQTFYHVNVLNHNLQIADMSIKLLNIKQQYTTIVQHLLLAIVTCRNLQDKIIEAIDKKHFHHILKNEEFEKEINVMQSHVSVDKLVCPFSNLHELYTNCEIFSSIDEKSIVFQIQVPLVKTNNFVMYETFKIPKIYINKMVWLDISGSLLISENDRYFKLRSNLKDYCKIGNKSFICDHHVIEYNSNINCETELIMANKTTDCQLYQTNSTAQMIQISNDKILYTLPSSSEVVASCDGNKKYRRVIHGSGILKKRNDCKFMISNISLFHNSNYFSTIHQEIAISTGKFKMFYLPNMEKLENMRYKTEYNASHDIARLSEDITKLKAEEKLPDIHDMHNYIAIYSIIIFVIIYKVYNKCTRLNHNKYFG